MSRCVQMVCDRPRMKLRGPEVCWLGLDSSKHVWMVIDGLWQSLNVADVSWWLLKAERQLWRCLNGSRWSSTDPNEAEGSWSVLTMTRWLQSCVDGYIWSLTVPECSWYVLRIAESSKIALKMSRCVLMVFIRPRMKLSWGFLKCAD